MGVEAVKAEATVGDGPVTVPFGSGTVDVLPTGEWRSSALRALREGDFDVWAEKCLTPESLTVWDEADPTMDEVEAFFTAWSDATGQDPGKSAASRRSSRSTARR